MATVQRRSRRATTAGIILVALGLIFLIDEVFQLRGEPFLIGVGIAFIVAYYNSRRLLGFILAGSVLLALGLHSTLMDARLLAGTFEGGLFFLLLGAAFLVVYLVHTRVLAKPGRRNWPLVTGIVLWAVGAMTLLAENYYLLPAEAWDLVARFWPVLLIALGGWLLLRQAQGNRG